MSLFEVIASARGRSRLPRIAWALLATALVVQAAAAQPHASREIDRFLRRHHDETPIAGFSAVVVRGGQVLFQSGYGVERFGEPAEITARTPLAIGSLTKSMTALAVVQLVERGLVDLDAPVVRYLPWFRTADRRGAEITVRHLLHNTSGIPSGDRWLFSKDASADAAARYARSLSRVPLTRAPGESFEYSNENWVLAGLILSEVTGMSYSAYLQERVLDRLGMRSSSTSLARILEMDGPWGYSPGVDDSLHPAGPRFLASMLAAGSELRASAEDIGRYLLMLLQGGTLQGERILSRDGVEALFEPGVVTRMTLEEMGILDQEAGYAMGWMVTEVDGRTIIQHGGNAVVMGSWTMIDRSREVAASLLYNGPELDAYRYPTKAWVVNNLLHLAAGEPLSDFGLPTGGDPTLNEFELPAELLDRYVGEYVSDEGHQLSIRKDPRRDRLLLEQEIGELSFRRSVDFASAVGAVLRDISSATRVTFLETPTGEITGLVGVPGGAYRKRRTAELTRTDTVVSPSGTLTFQLPRGWQVAWEGEAFRAHAANRPDWVLAGGAGRPSRLDPAEEPAPAAEIVARLAETRSETVGRHLWREWLWTEGEGERGRQWMLALTEGAGEGFHLVVSTPFGERTQAVRDVLVPMMKSLDVDSSKRLERERSF